MSSIDFSELIPPRLKVNNLPDGSSLELIRREEMGPEELAQFQSLQNRVDEVDKNMKKTNNQQATLKLVEKMDELLGEGVRMLCPGITDEQLALVKMGQRLSLVRWWGKVHKEEAAQGNG